VLTEDEAEKLRSRFIVVVLLLLVAPPALEVITAMVHLRTTSQTSGFEGKISKEFPRKRFTSKRARSSSSLAVMPVA
jgi:hypothetical protein